MHRHSLFSQSHCFPAATAAPKGPFVLSDETLSSCDTLPHPHANSTHGLVTHDDCQQELRPSIDSCSPTANAAGMTTAQDEASPLMDIIQLKSVSHGAIRQAAAGDEVLVPKTTIVLFPET